MVYRVLADGIDIFGSDTESSLLSPSLETELNSAGSLEFTLPPDHPSYDDISLMQTEIEVYEDDDLIFFGRPSEVSIDWNKQKKVVCEGALAYFNDAAIRPHKFEGALISDVFKYIIAQYNAQVAQNKQFIIGNITIVDRYVYTEFDYDICLSVLISTCIDSTGGYLFLRKEEAGIYIDWLAEVPDASDQPVQFASNMLDLNQDTRAEDICTVVLPVGGQVDGANITIAPVNQGSDILEDSDAIAKYGRILKIQQWNDIVDPQALKDKATEWLAKQQEDDITIETDAAELHYIDGSVGAYRIGQLVNVISGPHGVDKEYPILKMSMNLDSGTKKITLGTPPRKELTELSGITNSTGGGSSSGGGGGGGSTGVTDVIVNGSSVVSDHVARISAVTPQQLALKADEEDLEALAVTVAGKANQSDLNALSTTVAGKASQADLNALSGTVASKQDQLTPGTGISIDANNVISATGGGGTDVEANPSEPATDDLNTIKIGETVYDIPGGGSATNYGKFKCDVLFDTPASTSAWGSPIDICSEEKAKEYDMIHIISYTYANEPVVETVLINSIGQSSDSFFLASPRTNSNVDDIQGFIFLAFTNSKLCFYTGTGNTTTLYKVYGLKFENKLINRSDIYSEEERMIGRWTDGKPLYQKTWIFDSWVNFPNNAWTPIVNNVTIPFDYIVTCDGFQEDQAAVEFDMWFDTSSNSLKSKSLRTENETIKGFTLKYTKTTDTPGSGVIPEDPLFISDPMIFSEEEQIVGSWTDGKPIYQKTMSYDFTFSVNDWTLFDDSVSYEKMVAVIPIMTATNSSEDQVMQYGDSETTPRWCIKNDHKMYYYLTNARRKGVITFQYTKTTDSILSGPKKGKIVQRSDIYSEEERLIGRWTDGKPLYQKTIVKDLTLSSSWQNYYDLTGIDLVNVEINKLMRDGEPIPLAFSNNGVGSWIKRDGYLKFCVQGSQASEGWVLKSATLQYTKSTDAPFSKQLIEDPQFVMTSDIYSEEEQVVGRWTDGKPLYQKTIPVILPSSNGFVCAFSANVDYMVDIHYHGLDTSNFFNANSSYGSALFYYNKSNNSIYIDGHQYWMSGDSGYFTFQYTKTTDAPGTGPTKGNLIYLPALYSEEEREVGVWKDGKPLYQKCLTGTVSSPNNDWVEFGTVSNNVDTVVYLKSCFRYSSGDAIEERYITARYASGKVYYYCENIGNVTGTGVIVIQYTKTTDQPGSGTWTPEGQLAHHYSTSEKIVGTWIDGSTVYERTITGFSIALQSGSVRDTGVDISYVSKLISVNALGNDDISVLPVAGYKISNTLQLLGYQTGNVINCAIIQYTKSS